MSIPSYHLVKKVLGIPTELLIQTFDDRIFVVITQNGKVGCLTQATLLSSIPLIRPSNLFPTPTPTRTSNDNPTIPPNPTPTPTSTSNADPIIPTPTSSSNDNLTNPSLISKEDPTNPSLTSEVDPTNLTQSHSKEISLPPPNPSLQLLPLLGSPKDKTINDTYVSQIATLIWWNLDTLNMKRRGVVVGLSLIDSSLSSSQVPANEVLSGDEEGKLYGKIEGEGEGEEEEDVKGEMNLERERFKGIMNMIISWSG
ncbi:hypothetical protein TREMEDRAFT_72626 [Tremella mesenterica DSM 1558]|uniref:uncharacterized protein n=1 Tax=Tremella mesenterica (strain ATCC 24925 / CBS 8224 / DSM 1558 / NBRC 9311 / NRRL Y-6157 / RJB 2259-6 / UBC 559-6) TaxID=578456 RepID=UPI0003F4A1A5|nr:uncharacterized protein TREMEDRAFT_72626 [Tremella mesenterica DSM 1558]EIW71991.1 hypothetical protein TREMEDRAFT_72626 [Tremella mesenterica DSM 1558]